MLARVTRFLPDIYDREGERERERDIREILERNIRERGRLEK
jgi:hypothetical protein